MPKDAQGCPRRLDPRKPLHKCFHMSERPMTLNPTCFTVLEMPQEAPGGSFTLNPTFFYCTGEAQEAPGRARRLLEWPQEAPGGRVCKEKTRQK